MVSVFSSSAVDRVFEHRSGQIKDYIKLVERANTGWLGIRIMCPSGVTCISMDCCFSELAL